MVAWVRTQSSGERCTGSEAVNRLTGCGSYRGDLFVYLGINHLLINHSVTGGAKGLTDSPRGGREVSQEEEETPD